MKILVINGSPSKKGSTKSASELALECVKEKWDADILDLSKNEVDCFIGFGEKYSEKSKRIVSSLKDYDGFIICSPVYNASFSSMIKNLFEHVDYKTLGGKVAGFIVVSGGSLSYIAVQTQLTTLMSYFKIISNPSAVFLGSDAFDKNKKIKDRGAKKRIDDLVESTINMIK
jgi:NAD(P)H-dependent FMN reductase